MFKSTGSNASKKARKVWGSLKQQRVIRKQPEVCVYKNGDQSNGNKMIFLSRRHTICNMIVRDIQQSSEKATVDVSQNVWSVIITFNDWGAYFWARNTFWCLNCDAITGKFHFEQCLFITIFENWFSWALPSIHDSFNVYIYIYMCVCVFSNQLFQRHECDRATVR